MKSNLLDAEWRKDDELHQQVINTERRRRRVNVCKTKCLMCRVCVSFRCVHTSSLPFSGMQGIQYFRYRRWVTGKQCSQPPSDQSSEEKKLLCCKPPVASVWAAGQTAGCRAAADNATTFCCCVVSGHRLRYQWAWWQRMELPKKCKTILDEKKLFAVH